MCRRCCGCRARRDAGAMRARRARSARRPHRRVLPASCAGACRWRGIPSSGAILPHTAHQARATTCPIRRRRRFPRSCRAARRRRCFAGCGRAPRAPRWRWACGGGSRRLGLRRLRIAWGLTGLRIAWGTTCGYLTMTSGVRSQLPPRHSQPPLRFVAQSLHGTVTIRSLTFRRNPVGWSARWSAEWSAIC